MVVVIYLYKDMRSRADIQSSLAPHLFPSKVIGIR